MDAPTPPRVAFLQGALNMRRATSKETRQVGRVYLPRELRDRISRILRRLGSDWPLAHFTRIALQQAAAKPEELQPVPGPYACQLANVECSIELIENAKDAARHRFGDRKRGAYSEFVRSALDRLTRHFESESLPVPERGALSAANLPQLFVSEDMNSRVTRYLKAESSDTRSRFTRQALRYAFRHPEQLPASPPGPFLVSWGAMTAPAALVRRTRRIGQKDPCGFMRRALELRLLILDGERP